MLGRESTFLKLSFFPQHHAYIACIAFRIDDFIINCLTNGASFFIDMHAIGVDAFTQVWAEFDKALGQVLRGDIPCRQRTYAC